MKKILMYRNGKWAMEYHSNFHINEAKRHAMSVSFVEKKLSLGECVRIGNHLFKQVEGF